MERAHIDAMLGACDIITFDGPNTAYVAHTPYVTLTSLGIKPEGVDVGSCERADEAWLLFFAQLIEYAKGARQIAWRRSPALDGETGKWRVSCRLAKF